MGTSVSDLTRARRLERLMVRVRWFGAVLGVYLVSQTNSGAPPHASDTVLAFAYAVMAVLVAVNMAISLVVPRVRSPETMGRLGLAAFAFDAAVLFALTWAFSYDPKDSTWVILYILPLEGALRYRLEGALVAVAMTLANEIAREAYLATRFPAPLPDQFITAHSFEVANVAFRVGIQAIVALVAGFMARSLAREADRATELLGETERLLSHERETMQRLRELDQMKSDFISITSHELRTPLTAIRGFVKTLIRNRPGMSDDQVDEFVGIIDRHSERLSRLVEDLLLVSRIESGGMQLQIEDVDLTGFLREMVDSFGPDERSRIRLEAGGGGLVRIDPYRVDQILRNLVGNALKFSPPDSPVTLAASSEDGRLRFAVTDRGAGIPASELPQIFERFHQAEPALTRSADGAGLGLYITKRLVEAMGGSIEATSTPGQGSTFRVALPLTTQGTAGAR